MKIGFILECKAKGPDADIYPYLAKKFCPNIEILSIQTLEVKLKLINDGPNVALTLIEEGCDFVFMIWDRMPKWGGTGKCEDDIVAIEQRLEIIHLDRKKIILCCIKDMLESWMLGDGSAITSYFRTFSKTHPIPKFPDYKSEAEQSKPEEKLKKYNGRYDKYSHNFGIVKEITDFKRIARHNNSFKFFKESVATICSQ